MSAKSNKNAKTRLIDWLGIALLVALAAVLVQATPVKDMFWQGQWQNSANAGGQSITNLGSLTATNTITGRYFVGDGASLTNLPAPASAVQTNRTIATTSPLTGGGDLSTNRTFAFDGTAAFNLSGATNLNASNLASGTVAVARLPVIPATSLSATNSPALGDVYRFDSSTNGYWSPPAAGGSGTVTSVTLTQPSAGLTISGTGVAITSTGSPTFALANDLLALEGLASTGYAKRTGTDTWTQVTIIPIAEGGTGVSLSSTGGTGQVLKQSSSGATITVGTISFSEIASTPTTLAGYGISDAVPSSRTITATSPLTIGGSSADLSANRTIALGTVPIANGGTSQTTATAAFDALAPSSPGTGSIILSSSGSWGKLTIGSNGTVLTSNGTTASWAASASFTPSTAEVRLSASPSVALSTTDISGATVIYLYPWHGGDIALYDGVSAWTKYNLSGAISLTISSYTADKNYDFFCYNNSGTPALESEIWTNDTTRNVSLTTVNGVLVKSGATTRRYVGTIRIVSGGGACDDTSSFRGCWSMYNRTERFLIAKDTTDSWAYTTAAWRETRGQTTLGVTRVGYVNGLSEDAIEAVATSICSTYPAASGVGLDGTLTTNVAQIFGGHNMYNTVAIYRGYPGIGWHTVHWLEYGIAAGTFYGDNNLPTRQSGMYVRTRQ